MLSHHAKFFLKTFASPILDGLGVYDRQLRQIRASSWTILMYHRVIDKPADDPFTLGMCVSQANFDAQLGYFKRHFQPIAMAEAARRIAQGHPLPERAFSVTFDDGYLDNLSLALPILQKHQLPMALFVPTGGLDDHTPLWWDRVIFAMDATDLATIDPSSLGCPLPPGALSLESTQRKRSLIQILESLWTLPIAQAMEVVVRLERALPPKRHVAPVAARMTRAQLLQMHQAGIEIAAHSVRHPNLLLESPESVRHEMQASKYTLEQLCGAQVAGFAYPAGWKNADTIAAAQESGFTYTVCTERGLNYAPMQSSLYTLRRIGMPNSRVADFKRALVSIVK
jgi:peptidoglycan/xylan/chitin deacetylase (PgdA/CDA1 family)